MKHRLTCGLPSLKPMLFVAGLVMVAAASAQLSSSGNRGTGGTINPTGPYITAPDHLIVSFKPGTSPTLIKSLAIRYGLTVNTAHSGKYFTRFDLSPSHMQAGVRPSDFIRPLQANSAVNYAELDVALTPDFVPNDPDYNQQWFHDNTGQFGGTVDADVDSDEAWDSLSDISETVVAVCDDGVDIDHEDLSASIWVNPGEIPGNSIDDDNNGFVDDVNGWDTADNDNDPRPEGADTHGTHVAGIINATQDNGVGVSGVAPKAKIMALRHYAGQASWMSDLATAIDYAWANGADVINVSYNIDGFTQTLVDAIARADAADVVYLNSAGNNGQHNPPRQAIRNMVDNAIFVAATDDNDNLSSFSNWGDFVEVGAPGQNILSTVVGGYAFFDGTSMATPLAAGVVANIRGRFPALSDREALDLLMSSSDQVASLSAVITDGLRVNTATPLAVVVTPTGLTGMNLLLGTLMSGNLAALEDSDDTLVQVQSEGVAERGQYSAFEATASSPKSSVDIKALKINLESSASLAGVIQYVTIFNYDTGKWDLLSSQQLTTTDTVINLAASKLKVHSYVDPNSQEVKIRFEAYVPYRRKGVFPTAFDYNVDQIEVKIN